MTKKDLKTGMFGVMNTGRKFVVVDGDLVYDTDVKVQDGFSSGGWDSVELLDSKLRFSSDWYIESLHNNCRSFSTMDDSSIIWIRKQERNCKMTISEIEEKLGIENLVIVKEDNK